MHSPEPEIPRRAHAQMLLAAHAKHTTRRTDSRTNFGEMQGSILIRRHKLLKSDQDGRVLASSQPRFDRTAIGHTPDHRMDQRPLQRPRRLRDSTTRFPSENLHRFGCNASSLLPHFAFRHVQATVAIGRLVVLGEKENRGALRCGMGNNWKTHTSALYPELGKCSLLMPVRTPAGKFCLRAIKLRCKILNVG
jgi:hypothetical protein